MVADGVFRVFGGVVARFGGLRVVTLLMRHLYV